MRKFCNWMMLVCLAVVAPATVKADFSQIPGVFAPTTFGGGTSYQSVYDTGSINAGELRNFSVAYDNFRSVGTNGELYSLSWVGKYYFGVTPRTNTFHIDIFADNGSNAPVNDLYTPTPVYSQVVTASEEATGVVDGIGDEFFKYTAYFPAFSMTAGTNYWLSISGQQPYGDNAFGWAFSPVGDGVSKGDFQASANAVITRFNIGSDFAFDATIQAVPEPSSCLLLAGALGTIGVRKWRARRKVAA